MFQADITAECLMKVLVKSNNSLKLTLTYISSSSMPPKAKRRAPPLKAIRKLPPSTTQLQDKFLEQRAKDLRHAEKFTDEVQRFLIAGPSNQDSNDVMDLPEEDGDNLDSYINSNGFDGETPPPGSPIELDPVLEAMAQAQYQASRLQHQERWSAQYIQMLPGFLRCRLWTSNWGTPQLWDHDYRPECQCPTSARTERLVDVVDTYSESKICFK